jgi:O-antigen/teichoic acid export membrane protein
MTQPRRGENLPHTVLCPRCSTVLPSHAIFCSFCGDRIKWQKNGRAEARPPVRHAEETIRIPPLLRMQRQDRHPSQPLVNYHTTEQGYQRNTPLLEVRTPLQRSILLARSLLQRARGNFLLRNSIYIMGTGVATSILGFFYWILAARLYSTYDVGLGAALIAAMTLGSVLANLGIGSTLVQVLPHRESGHAWSLTVNAGLTTGTVAGLLAGAITVIVLPLFSNQFAVVWQHAGYILILVIGVPLLTISTLLDQVFIAERAAHNMFVRNVAVAILKIPLMVLPVVLLAQLGTLGIVSSGILATAIAVIGAWLWLVPRLKRGHRLAIRGIVGQIRSMISSLTGHYFINLGGLATMYLLPVIVSVRLSPADNAYFYTTSRVGDFLLTGSAAVATSLFVEGSHTSESLSHKIRSSAKTIALLLGPGILVCYLAGYYILSVFGTSYAQHGLIVLRIEALASVPDATTNIYISVLRIQKRLRLAAMINVGMSVLTLVLGWILVPKFGIAGVPICIFIGQGTGSLVAGADYIRTRRRRYVIGEARLTSDSGNTENKELLSKSIKL